MIYHNPSRIAQRFTLGARRYDVPPAAECEIPPPLVYLVKTRRMVLRPGPSPTPGVPRVLGDLVPRPILARANRPAVRDDVDDAVDEGGFVRVARSAAADDADLGGDANTPTDEGAGELGTADDGTAGDAHDDDAAVDALVQKLSAEGALPGGARPVPRRPRRGS